MHFDVVVRDVERASAFYEKALGWKIQKWDGPMDYWLISTGEEGSHGIDGGMSVGEPNFPMATLTLDVASVGDTLKLVKEAGGTQTRDISPVPGVGWLAEIQDTEGNQWGLMQEDPTAGSS
jgi:predicted enzyme related to lactoylglutathione lyase